MPSAKIHVLEGQYDEAGLGAASSAVQNELISVLGIPPEDFFQIIHILSRSQFFHAPSFLGTQLRQADRPSGRLEPGRAR